MPTASATALTTYPAYCWTASPTYNTWVKLSAADIHALVWKPGYEGQRLYFHLNHPIRFIRLVGLVVSFDDATETTLLDGPDKIAKTVKTPWKFTVDDGSGENIDVICWKDDSAAELATRPGELIKLRFADLHRRPGKSVTDKDISLDEVELGKVVKVKGWIDEFRGRRQILLERVNVVKDTAEEVVAWAELADFQSKVLSKPWNLTKDEITELRHKEERRQRKLSRQDRRQRDAAIADAGLDGGAEKRPRVRIAPTSSSSKAQAKAI